MATKNTLFSYFTKKGSNQNTCDEPKKTHTSSLTKSKVDEIEESSTKKADTTNKNIVQKIDTDSSLRQPSSMRKYPDEEDPSCDEDLGTDNCKENSPQNRRPSVKSITRSGRQPKCKRRRIIDSESEDVDSEEDYKPDVSDGSSAESDSSGVESLQSDIQSEEDSPIKSRKRKLPSKLPGKTTKKEALSQFSSPATPCRTAASSPSTPFTPSVGNKTKSKLAAFSAPDTPVASTVPEEGRIFPHLSLDFLAPDKIKDADKHSKDHSDYDPRSLYVPESFLNKQTPAMRQWWVIKAKLFDKVLFFKMGKFYELFNMDAAVAVTELGLIYMKGEHAHAGFPEIAFGRYSETLIQKGYKIARIEQTETPDMMQERCRSMSRTASKFDKVVRREVCSVQTCGTRRYSFLDGDSCSSSHSYLLAVCERALETGAGEAKMFGICFIDTSIGVFHVGQFEDDRHCSRFTTLISHYPPAQVLHERGKLSEKTNSIITNRLKCMRESLKPGSQFWDATSTLKFLMEGNYFSEEGKEGGKFQWPSTLKNMISEGDTLGLTPAEDCELGLSAMGAVVWYLKESLVEHELLSMKQFQNFTPLDLHGKGVDIHSALNVQHMVLDGVTLFNLDVVTNSCDGGSDGTLLQQLDHCNTPFGKRLLKQWLCAPLCNPDSINDRLNAIEDLSGCQATVTEVSDLMRKLPDLDRLLSKIHTLGLARRSQQHPDGRAIYFEDVAYSKKKIEDFMATLDGFKIGSEIADKFETHLNDFKSKLLRQTVGVKSSSPAYADSRFPDLKEQINFFERSFDHKKAKAEGIIKPSKGVDDDYDQAVKDIGMATCQLDDYLAKQKKRLGCSTLTYWGSAKNRFQIEVPDAVAKSVPHEYEMMSSKKGFKRYRTREIGSLFGELTTAEELRDIALKSGMQRLFHQFDSHSDLWARAVACLSVLDVLMSLAEYSRCGEGSLCRPSILPPSHKPFIRIQEGKHPCISQTFSGDFIPNDTNIGTSESGDGDSSQTGRLVLVTGPNMGGKSTLMRQVGCITIMAHLGCYVPAEACEMTPVDRVFTRLGASDRIMAGESTFFMELSETSAILQHATQHSLVLLDELGRGTATYDGTAIACGVVQELSRNIRCRSLFSTHYHSLVEEFSHDPNISLAHMACMVENDDCDQAGMETITFLYKLVPGACPKSYGFNAARLANIPEKVIQVAIKKACEFEASGDRVTLFRSLCKLPSDTSSEIIPLLQSLAAPSK